MKIGLYSNLTRDPGALYTKDLFRLLTERGVEVLLSDDLRDVEFSVATKTTYSNAELARNSELIIVLGGDGTILRIAKECATFKTPVFCINLGHKGFLSEVNKEDFDNDFNDLLNDNYIVDKRKFLKVKISNSDEEYYALNEVVVAQELCSRVLKAEISVNGTMVDRYTSDGIIVSTPTGSTAYSLSAGGPIVAPDVDAFVIAPICAHSLHSRPMIVSNKSTVQVKILDAIPGANVNIDGQNINRVEKGTFIEVSDSDLYVSFLRNDDYNFYNKLLGKMRRWSSIEV